jgi:hypothetical protein
VSAVAPPTSTVHLVVAGACGGVVAAKTALRRYVNHAMDRPPLLDEELCRAAVFCAPGVACREIVPCARRVRVCKGGDLDIGLFG